jgi:hypothetical protein
MNFQSNETSSTETSTNFESFDAAPYPFAILLGSTTTLLLISTVRSLWLLATA